MKRWSDKNFLIPLSRNESLKPHPRLPILIFLAVQRIHGQAVISWLRRRVSFSLESNNTGYRVCIEDETIEIARRE